MRKLFIPFLLLPFIPLWHCANPVTPTGGNKDITPPAITFTNPKNKSINVKPSQVTFKFDENIQVNNAKEQIVVSPKPKHKIDLKTKSNSVTIYFPEGALDENTTYSINLNEGIKDLNESNQGLYQPLLFSTGNSLDTQSIKGKCVFIEEPKTPKLKIMALSGKDYHSIADKSHRFSLDGLAKDSLYLLAFNDLNSNDVFDKNEDAGLMKSKPGDTTLIFIYPLQRKKLGLYKYANSRYGITGLNYNEDRKGIINFMDTLIGDSTSIYTLLEKTDSIKFIIPKKAEKKSYAAKYILKKPAFLSDSLQQIKIVANETFLSKKYNRHFYINRQQKTDSCNTSLHLNIITYQFKNNQTGSISIPFNYETESKRIFNDTIKTSVPVYTSFVLNNNEVFEAYVTIKNKNTTETYASYLKPKETIVLWVLAGDYEINYYEDKNSNNLLDGPDFSNKTPGEYYRRLPDLRIKENMAVDLNLKGSEKP